MTLIQNPELGNQLEEAVAQSVTQVLARWLPASLDEVVWLFKYYGIQFRVDFTRGGQDCSTSRVNIKTDGKGTVKNLSIG